MSENPDFVALSTPSKKLSGKIALPGSKSITNRVLLLAALANGKSHITGALKSDDTKYMAHALRQLGVKVEETGETEFLVASDGNLHESKDPLFLGNAGTAVRFLTAACATINGTTILTGDEHMQKRPIAPLIDALKNAGIDANAPTNCPPVTIKSQGGFKNRNIEIDASLSSQYVSALLMTANKGDAPFKLRVKDGEIGALGYINITLDCMREFGAKVTNTGGLSWEIENSPFIARDYWVEPDASAATYIWGINALLKHLNGSEIDIGIAPHDMMQPDKNAFDEMQHFPNMRAEINGSQMQDAIPTLAVLAAFANAPVRFIGVKNLRVKECDRVSAIATELNKIHAGMAIEHENDDELLINPNRDLIGATRNVEIETYNDHRIAMAFALAGLVINGIKILNPACTSKTYPKFWKDLESVGVKLSFE